MRAFVPGTWVVLWAPIPHHLLGGGALSYGRDCVEDLQTGGSRSGLIAKGVTEKVVDRVHHVRG